MTKMISFGVNVSEDAHDWLVKEADRRGGVSLSSVIRSLLRLAMKAYKTDPAAEAYMKAVRGNGNNP